MKFEIKSEDLKKAINACLQVNRESIFKIDSNRWSTVVSDPANVCMVAVDISKSVFDVYPNDFGELDKYEIGLDLYKVNDILKSYNKDSDLSIKFNDSMERMQISNGVIEYNILLLEKEYIKSDSLPIVDYQCEIAMQGKEFYKSCIACRKVNKYLHIGCDVTSEKLYFKASNDSDSIEVNYTSDELIEMKLPSDNVDSLFSYEYLEKIIKSFDKSDDLYISLGNDYPLRIKFDSGVYNEVEYVFLLAPRIED